MTRRRPRVRRARDAERRRVHRAAAAALALLALPLLAADETDVDEFFPLSIGNRWTYRIHRDRTVAPAGGPQERRFFYGHMVSEVLSNKQHGRRTLQVVRMITTQWPASGGDKERSQEIQQLAWGGGGLVLFVVKELDKGMTTAVEAPRRPQLRLIDRKLEAGRSWRAGTLRIDRLEVRLEAEVVGFEDVELEKQTFEDCLRVRYHGPIEGWIDVSDGAGRIGWGKYEQEVWYSRGVGIVQNVYRMRGEMVLPGSRLARFNEVARRQLETHVLR